MSGWLLTRCKSLSLCVFIPFNRHGICRERKYVAIKSLKGYATDLVNRGLIWELAVLRRITSTQPGPTPSYCLQLLDHFTQPGQSGDGDHPCSVTELLGGDVKSLQIQSKEKNKTPLPLPLAKKILLHALRGIAYMHSRGIVHTACSIVDFSPQRILPHWSRLTRLDATPLNIAGSAQYSQLSINRFHYPLCWKP